MADIFSETAKALKEISYSLNFPFISVAYFVQTGGVNWRFNGSGPSLLHYGLTLFLFNFFVKTVIASFFVYIIFFVITQALKKYPIFFLLVANFFIGVGVLGLLHAYPVEADGH